MTDSNMQSARKPVSVVTPPDHALRLNLKEVWEYRELMTVFVRRDFVTKYKQTILGPLWSIIRPLFTTVVFTIVFGKLAALTTADGVMPENFVIPSFLFYMIGNICWNYFCSVVKSVAGTFISNAHIMGKVYFPRIITPLSTGVSELINFGIQFGLFLVLYIICVVSGIAHTALSPLILLFPLSVVQLAMLGCGVGMIICSSTTKYRDLMLSVDFMMQLWQYFSPIAYGFMLIPQKWRSLYMLNPFTPIVTTVRYEMFGAGYFSLAAYGYSWIVCIVIFLVGIVAFNKAEQLFTDTV